MILREKNTPVGFDIPGAVDQTNKMDNYNNNNNNKNKNKVKSVCSSYKCFYRSTLLYYLFTFWCFNIIVIENCYGLPLNRDDSTILNNFNNIVNLHEDKLKVDSIDNNTRIKRAPAFYSDKLLSYLQDFGYLPQTDKETGNLRSDDQLKDAIKNMQAFANIPVTGVMDKETKILLRKPRCGLPDVSSSNTRKKRFTIQGQKWHTTNITWSLQTTNLQSLDHGRVRRELYKALDIWAQNSRLTFKEVNSPNADILVYFQRGYHGDGYPFDGRGLILAHAFFPGTGRGGDAHFDEDEVWQLEGDSSEMGGTSLFAVAAHEFGHSLGLSHSSVSGALMFPWYQGWKQDFQLPDDDRYGIQQLYGAKEKQWGKIPIYEPDGGRGRYPYRPPNNTPRYRPQQPTTPRTTTMAPTTTTPHPRGDKPDTCDTSYDAISVIRSEVFIFKGKYMWRIDDKGLQAGYPVQINRMWTDLPSDLTHVDAVYEKLNKSIVFFIGRKIYLFNGNTLERGYPRDLTTLGLPESLDNIDGAMVWGHNSKTYFFSGTMYWRYDEEAQHVELDYPRDMSIWKGVGYYIDDVFQWKDAKTYFFKGKGFWKFNDLSMRVENERQTLSAPFWMGCPGVNHDRETITKDKYYNHKRKHSSGRNEKYRTSYNENTNDYEVNKNNSADGDNDNNDKGSGSQIYGLFVTNYILSLLVIIYRHLLY